MLLAVMDSVFLASNVQANATVALTTDGVTRTCEGNCLELWDIQTRLNLRQADSASQPSTSASILSTTPTTATTATPTLTKTKATIAVRLYGPLAPQSRV